MDAPPIQYARTDDGVNIAYAQVGTGPPLIRSLGWFTHLEMEWASAPGRYFWQELSRRYRVIRFDGRGMGLSDREVAEFSLEARLRDLEAVIEATCDTPVIVMGLSEGCAAAVAYAARRPEHVANLVLYGGFARFGQGKHRSASAQEQMDALVTILREGWGRAHPAFRQLFASLQLPSGTADQLAYFDAMQRASATAETAARMLESVYELDVRAEAGEVSVPTLVLHRKDDRTIPFAWGRQLAAAIPGAQFVPLPGENHQIWVGDESEITGVSTAIDAFLGPTPIAPDYSPDVSLTPRQEEVLRLLATGLGNPAIAEALTISPNTVIRHVNNIYNKLGVQNRVEATIYAIRHGIAPDS